MKRILAGMKNDQEKGRFMHIAVPSDEDEKRLAGLGAENKQQEPKTPQKKNLQRFVDWKREDQIQAFLLWLPKELHDAPGIDWTQLPSHMMGYCIRTLANSPDSTYVVAAIASLFGAMTTHSLVSLIGNLNKLFQILRSTCNMNQLSDLQHEQIWHDFVTKTKLTEGQRKKLQAYASVTKQYFPEYLQRLEASDRQRMQAYVLPPMPHDFSPEICSSHRCHEGRSDQAQSP
jgi:hypothetical protein